MEDKILVTPKQAKDILAENNGMCHTFLNASFGLIGADHSIKSLHKDIDKAKTLEIAGESAMKMQHALAIFKHGAKLQSDILFVETDMNKVEQLLEARK